jgi:hypothetical protein
MPARCPLASCRHHHPVAGGQALAGDLDLAVGEQARLHPHQLPAAVAFDLDRVAALGQGEQGVDRDASTPLRTSVVIDTSGPSSTPTDNARQAGSGP